MTTLKTFSQTLLKGSAAKSLLLAGALLSFTACEDGLDDMYNNNFCKVTAEQIETQKALDIEVIEKHFEDNNIDITNLKTTPSGLHYFVLTEGSGDLIKEGDKVGVHYVGKNLSGDVFDSSYDRAQLYNLTVGVTEVIKGWTEGLQLMRVGEEARFYIPSTLAYGRCGNPQGGIPSNAVLVFDIKVVKKY